MQYIPNRKEQTMSENVEKLKVFSRTALIDPVRGRNEDFFDFEKRMKSMRKEIPLIEDDFNAWRKENPNLEIIRADLQSHLGVAQPSTSFSFSTSGWMCHVANLFITYREKVG